MVTWPLCRLSILDRRLEMAVPGLGPVNHTRTLPMQDVKVVTFTGRRRATGLAFTMTDGNRHLFTCLDPTEVHSQLTEAGYRTSPIISRDW